MGLIRASNTTLLFTNAADGKLSTVEQYDLATGAIDRLALPEGSSVVAVSQ
jgi:hypothetical protein